MLTLNQTLYSIGGNSGWGETQTTTGFGSGGFSNAAGASSAALAGFSGCPGILLIDEYA